ncbi:MAG: biopolymer transporter ExbD [Deltaproteobacteria bacterium]|jgi:biopolymer transport protein ExbD|nr:biopolymer transporter ExbD [Deltaproteobacteria bacterium]
MQFKEKTDSDAHLDITPIVDTVFNLLIFFALSLNFIVTPGIKVNLPESSTEEIVREKEEIVIVIKQGNEIFINNSSVSIEQLFLILSESAQRNRETLIIIQADQEVSHGRVVKVMDTAKRAGLTRLAIATIVMKETIAKGR